MMDPTDMFPNGFHHEYHEYEADLITPAKPYTRTQKPPKYYFIDFGLSRKYNPEDGPPREHPILGGDKTVPEFQNWNGVLVDPFPADIYYLGNMMKTWVLEVGPGHCL